MTHKLINAVYKDLVYNPDINARGDAETDIAELTAMIRAEGIGQPLLVRPAKRNKSKYEIVEGSRRWRAIGALIDAGDWQKTQAIPCMLRELDDEQAIELSLSNALSRLPLGAAEEAIAFTRMKKPVAEIAIAFGIPERRVEQRLAIGQLHPPILAALKANEISIRDAEAFTLTPDTKRQAKVWKEFLANDRGAWWVKEMLTDKATSSKSKEAVLVGEEAYLAAGGAIRRDLFGEDVWFEDRPLLLKLFEEKLAVIVSDYEKQGWSFVHVVRDTDDLAVTRWQRLTPKGEPSPEDAKRLKQIEREIASDDKKLVKLRTSDEDATDAQIDEEDALEEKIAAARRERDEIESRNFTDRQKAVSGVVISFGHRGELQIEKGKTKPGKVKQSKQTRDAKDEEDTGGSTTPRAEEEPDFAGAVLADLAGVMGGALQMTLVEKPGQALRLAIATLVMQDFDHVPFSLTFNAYAAPSPAQEQFKALIDELLRDAEGKDFAKTLAYLDELDEDALIKLLAILLADSLSWTMHHDAAGKALIRRLDPDCTRWFKADEAFFNRLTRPQLVDALADVDAVDARGRSHRKKPELVARCVEVLAPLNWLPAPLRAPCYTGPGSEAYAVLQAEAIAARSSDPSPLAGEGGPGLDPGADEGSERHLEAAE